MKKGLLYAAIILGLAGLMYFGLTRMEKKWAGVDENVVEKFAEEAGHPARKPFINTDQGDLLLFVFLIAGTVGGFVAGYYFRELFPTKTDVENLAARAEPHPPIKHPSTPTHSEP